MFSQNPTMKHHLLSTASTILAEASPFDPVWGIGLQEDDPEARNPRRWPRKFSRKTYFYRPRRHSHRQGRVGKPRLIKTVLHSDLARWNSLDFQRRLALWLWLAPAQVILWSFRPVFLTHRQTTAPRSWLSRPEFTPRSCYQNTAPASSAGSLPSTTPLSPRRPRFTVELTPSRLLVACRSLTLWFPTDLHQT